MSKAAKQHDGVPRLRFPTFKGEWKANRVGDIADIYKGKGIAKADISHDGSHPCIRYGELYTTYGEVITEIISKTSVSAENLFFSEPSDVIIPSSGETKEDIATAACVVPGGIALGGDLNVLRSREDGIFLSYYLNGPLRTKVARVAQGNSVVHLYPHQIEKLPVSVPSRDEQQKIADCLSSLDASIRAETRQLDTLKVHKQGLMQQLFPAKGQRLPRLRFPGFEGEWGSIPLGELASRSTLKNLDGRENRVLTNSAEYGVVDQRNYFHKDIADKGNLHGYYIVQKGDYVYNPRVSVSAPVGPISKNELGIGVMSPLYTIFRFHASDAGFFAQFFKSDRWHGFLRANSSTGARHDRMSIGVDAFMQMPVPDICAIEQHKIAACLASIDTLIAVQTRKIAALAQHKQGLMQGLFPALDASAA